MEGSTGGEILMPHKHRAIERLHREQGWTHCVTPVECAAKPERQSAHGGLTYTDICSCGAVRFTEANYPDTNYGPWEKELGTIIIDQTSSESMASQIDRQLRPIAKAAWDLHPNNPKNRE